MIGKFRGGITSIVFGRRPGPCKVRIVTIHTPGPLYILRIMLRNYEIAVFQCLGHISQQQNRSFLTCCAPHFPSRRYDHRRYRQVVSYREAKRMSGAMRTILVETQVSDPSSIHIPVNEQRSERLCRALRLDDTFS